MLPITCLSFHDLFGREPLPSPCSSLFLMKLPTVGVKGMVAEPLLKPAQG